MRKPGHRRRLSHLLGASGIAVIALGVLANVSEAAFRGGPSFGGGGFRSMSGPTVAPRAPMIGNSGGLVRPIMPRVQKLHTLSTVPGAIGRPGNVGMGKGKRDGNTVATGDGDGRKPPGRRPSRRPPGMGPVGPVGPIVGTGVAIGTLGPAIGGPSLPAGGGGSAGGPRGTRAAVYIPPASERRYVKDQIVLEFQGEVTRSHTAPILARHRLAPLDRAYFASSNTTVFLWKITDKRSVPTVLNQLRSGGALIAARVSAFNAQANFLYDASEQSGATFAPPQPASPSATPVAAASGARPAAGDPAQYALAKLRLSEAHSLATGNKVLVAVIDSGIDAGHPELQGVVAGSFDALNKPEKPHAHGTAIAGAIASQARLLGVAPAARILAIRAFGASGASAQATSFAIIKGVQHATGQGARVINMSFAGPQDPGLARHLAAAKASGVVLVAASGNFGPKSPPQYPAADPNVIAVSATDAGDQLFRAANRGSHIAVAAPGVDILLPAPNADYQLISGTSFAAAHVSGIAALLLERKPDLTPEAMRNILISTAKDLGRRGRDDEFGAGLVDAYQAILSVETSAGGGTVGGPMPAATPQVTAQ